MKIENFQLPICNPSRTGYLLSQQSLTCLQHVLKFKDSGVVFKKWVVMFFTGGNGGNPDSESRISLFSPVHFLANPFATTASVGRRIQRRRNAREPAPAAPSPPGRGLG
ncbi:MAG: hypothetical protein ABSH34_33790 [Verrucomicrobiota bacterium]